MSADRDEWAGRVARRYEDISLKDFAFWTNLVVELEEYSKAFNKHLDQELVAFERSSPSLVILRGPIVTLRLFLDAVTKRIYYGFSSQILADLASARDIPSITGSVRLIRQSHYPRLVCTPALILSHFSEDIDLNEFPNESKKIWPLHDALARCFIEKVLDADFFDKGTD
jgi:hypothetical protein